MPGRSRGTQTRSAPAEIVQALKRMQEVLDDRQIWVNPDCGLKTRGWPETVAALENMCKAAAETRKQLST